MKERDTLHGEKGITSAENITLEREISSAQAQGPTEDNLDDLDGMGSFKVMING
jgi:hypothetical protein